MDEDLMLPMEVDGESPGSPDGRTTKPRKKNRSPSPSTIQRGFAGGEVVLDTNTTAGAWTGAKKAKVQEGAPAPEDLDITAAADVNVINPEPEQGAVGQQVEGGFDWSQVEGFDWTEADVKEEIESFHRYVGLPDNEEFWNTGVPNEFWKLFDDQRTEDLRRRLAIYHIRGHKGAELSDAEVMSMLEEDGYFRPYEPKPKWHFDQKRCRTVGFQDYQRLTLRNDGYLTWDDYQKACSTLESDQQFVYLWEKLLDKTKWLQHYHKLTMQERRIMDRVTYYHAAKIVSADCPQIFSKLLLPFEMDFTYSVTYDHFYARLYFEIWKRVAKQKMNVKDALDEVKDEVMWPFDWSELKAELESDNYKTCAAGIDKNLEEGEAYWLIVEAVRKIDPLQLRLKTYYEYAKKKLCIAEKMGMIPSSPHTSI